jgi:nicotinate-nucleotide pyrophosphorylase (carboxylating)
VAVFDRDFGPYKARMRQRALEAFRDDLGRGDVTTEAVFKEDSPARAVVIAEEACTLAGVLEARAVLEDGKLKVSGKKDGDPVKKGDTILNVEGSLKQMLARERVSLNYLSRMSGIATLSRKLFKEHGPRVLFLRKTDPGLLFSEKRAVSLGGCLSHRLNLSDGILIKDNHLDQLAKGSDRVTAIKTAIARAAKVKTELLEIEVESVREAEAAAKTFKGLGIGGVIMLDNMSVADVKNAVKVVKSISKSITIEASGGITEDNIGDYLRAGADYASTSLFLAARPCRFNLEVQP